MQNIIDKFATHDIFGRENYEYYARVTGRILKVQDEWICSFQYPPPPRGKLAQQKYACEWSEAYYFKVKVKVKVYSTIAPVAKKYGLKLSQKI